MQNQIDIKLKNFESINNINININQINIISGSDTSGKSFLNKLLFCFLTSLSNERKEKVNQQLYNLFKSILILWIDKLDMNSLNLINDDNSTVKEELESLMESWNNNDINYDNLNRFYSKFEKTLKKAIIDERLNNNLRQLKQNIACYEEKFAYVNKSLKYLLCVEFGESSLKHFKGSTINLM